MDPLLVYFKHVPGFTRWTSQRNPLPRVVKEQEYSKYSRNEADKMRKMVTSIRPKMAQNGNEIRN
jgi:hypothetical protein